jgi:RHS repeat-associated protein
MLAAVLRTSFSGLRLASRRGSFPGMGYYAAATFPEKTASLQKNRVGGFSAFSRTCARRIPSQLTEPQQRIPPTLTETASGVRYYGYRFYSPETGRWISRDPIAEQGGLNVYAILGNFALGNADSVGLSGWVRSYIRYDRLENGTPDFDIWFWHNFPSAISPTLTKFVQVIKLSVSFITTACEWGANPVEYGLDIVKYYASTTRLEDHYGMTIGADLCYAQAVIESTVGFLDARNTLPIGSNQRITTAADAAGIIAAMQGPTDSFRSVYLFGNPDACSCCELPIKLAKYERVRVGGVGTYP